MNKEYIGDSVFIEHDGESFVLTTENGIVVSNIIFLETEHMEMIADYVKRFKGQEK